MNSPDTSFLKTVKDTLGKHSPAILTGVLAAITLFGQTQHKEGVNETKSADFERRIVLLENDRATRLEVQNLAVNFADFKKDTHEQLSHLQDLLLQDLRAHR